MNIAHLWVRVLSAAHPASCENRTRLGSFSVAHGMGHDQAVISTREVDDWAYNISWTAQLVTKPPFMPKRCNAFLIVVVGLVFWLARCLTFSHENHHHSALSLNRKAICYIPHPATKQFPNCEHRDYKSILVFGLRINTSPQRCRHYTFCFVHIR